MRNAFNAKLSFNKCVHADYSILCIMPNTRQPVAREVGAAKGGTIFIVAGKESLKKTELY